MIQNFHLQELTSSFLFDPATLKDIEWIAQLEAEMYSGEDVVPEEILREWYAANPTGFFVIKTKNGQNLGHIDILPVRPGTLRLFVEGAILERDIRGDSLYSPGERGSIRDLYIESLAVRVSGKGKISVLRALALNLPSLLCRIAAPENIETVYGMAATKPGERMMEHLGFQRVLKGEERKDGHAIFSAGFKMLMENIAWICRDLAGKDNIQYLKKGEP